MKVTFDSSTSAVSITIEQNRESSPGAMKGLCGSYNDDPTDDMCDPGCDASCDVNCFILKNE